MDKTVALPTDPEPRPSFTCPECRLGTARPTPVFYCGRAAGLFLTVPDFPAWTCDVCGFREYDAKALHELETVVRAQGRPQRLAPDRRANEDAADLALGHH